MTVQSTNPPPPAYFMLRVRRDGPLTPGRWWLCDHDPADPKNRLDRGRLSIYPRATVGGREWDPDLIAERAWAPINHWKSLLAITPQEYQYRLAHLEWTRRHRPADPVGRPNAALKPADLPLPNFDREKELA